jgi:hypothetical protein
MAREPNGLDRMTKNESQEIISKIDREKHLKISEKIIKK